MENDDKARVQLDLPRNFVENLDKMAKEAGITRKQFAVDSLGLLMEYVNKIKEGYVMRCERGEERVEIVLPNYNHLKPR